MIEIRLTSLESGTAEEYCHLEAVDEVLNARSIPEDVLALFAGTDRETGYPVSPMQHALQTATRAFRDGAADEMIFAALFHDIADRIAPINHARVGAEILRPYIGEETHWVLAHHSIFQGYYYWHHIGRNRDEREEYRGHPHFEACAAFCEKWDQRSFDPAYDTMPLAAFLPVVRRVFARAPYSQWQSGAGAATKGEP
jgi:predicted HD phosphohydrolase